MSLGIFLMRGTSMQGGIYAFKTSAHKQPAEIEKIKRMWESFKNNSTRMLMISISGMMAGAILIPGMAMFGAAVLTTSTALAILSGFRLITAKAQHDQWRIREKPQEKQVQEKKFDPVIYGNIPGKALLCRAYFRYLDIPQGNQADFLKDFFDSLKNPLHPFMRTHCPKEVAAEINPASDIYRQLYLSYTYSLKRIANVPNHGRQQADYNYRKVQQDNKNRLNRNEYILACFQAEARAAAQMRNPVQDLLKKQAIHDYLSAQIQAYLNPVKSQIDEWLTRYVGVIETAKNNYMDQLFQKAVALVDAFNKKNFSNLTKMEDFAFPEWEDRNFTIPAIDTIPYDATRLPGITEAEYRHYFTKLPAELRE